MKFYFSRYPRTIWAWMFWGLCVYLSLELGSFYIAKQVLHKNIGEFAGPYLAFAMPAAVFLPLVWRLLKREVMGVSPKRLARGWGLVMVLFFVVEAGAVFYSGVKLGFIDLSDAVIYFVVAALYCGLIAYFSMYQFMLKRISGRAAGRKGEHPFNECPK